MIAASKNLISNLFMSEQIALTIRALSDFRNGEVKRNDTYLLLNANKIDDEGELAGIFNLEFEGTEIPTPEDVKNYDLMVSGTFSNKSREGTRFRVDMWSIDDAIRKPSKKLTPDEFKKLASKTPTITIRKSRSQ